MVDPFKNHTHLTFRNFLRWLTQHRVTQLAILTLILLNALTLGMETSPRLMQAYGPILHFADRTILGLFITEILFRIIAIGPRRFFRSRWSLFDFTVISISLVPHGAEMAVLRTLRVLRVLRLISIVPAMRRVVNGLIASISGVFSVACILLLIFYVFAVIATHLYAGYSDEYFGSIGRSMFTLFQVMTLEGWSEVARDMMDVYPYSWVMFVSFILICTFTMLNLLVGVIVSTMETLAHVETEEYQGIERRKQTITPPGGIERRKLAFPNAAAMLLNEMREHVMEQKILAEVEEMRKEIAELKTIIKTNN